MTKPYNLQFAAYRSNPTGCTWTRLAAFGLAALLIFFSAPAIMAQDLAKKKPGKVGKGVSNLPVPRFASLKTDKVYVRAGPGKKHGVSWIFERAGLPVEIIGEFEHWRRIRDSENGEGWIFFKLLSNRRTALVTPWEKQDIAVPLYKDKKDTGRVLVKMQRNVIVNIERCDGTWCRVNISRFSGWVRQDRLWGIYGNEVLK